MTNPFNDLNRAQNEVSASSAGGAPFLICYGVTFLITGILSFFLPRETSALIAMFQGGLALPAALWLERRMGTTTMSNENPLKTLSGQMAMSQALALPFLIAVYSTEPAQIPVVLAGLGGVHFLPYAWLHRTKIYIALAVAVSLGAFALVLLLKSASYSYILLLVGVAYWVAAPLVHRHAKAIVAGSD